MNLIEIRNLEKTYPGFKLDRVSFDIPEGTITGFIGRNGAGKTTTIKAMLNLIHPDGGTIRIGGRLLTEQEAEVKSSIGYSTGSVSWYPRKRLKELIAVVKTFYDTWDEAAYVYFRELFGLSEDKCIREMSEGMKVKVNLLIALSHRARVLLLDEPTSGLDPFSRDELLDTFLQLKQEGVAVFFSTHIVSDIEKCADRILYISHGKIAAEMPKEDFVGKYSLEGENLEATFLRLEKEVRQHA